MHQEDLKKLQSTQTGEIESLKDLLKAAESSLAENEKRHEDEKVKLKALIEQNITKSHKTELANLHKQIEDLEKSKDSLNKDLDTKKSEHLSFKNEIENLNQQLNTLSSTKKSSDEQLLKTHKTQLDSLNAQISELKNNIQDLNTEKASVISQLESLKEQHEKETVEIKASHTTQLKQFKTDNKNLKKEIEACKNEIQALKGKNKMFTRFKNAENLNFI